MIKRVQHDSSVETLVMGNDHQPYSLNRPDAPDDVVDAVRGGFGFNVSDFDCREFDWGGKFLTFSFEDGTKILCTISQRP